MLRKSMTKIKKRETNKEGVVAHKKERVAL